MCLKLTIYLLSREWSIYFDAVTSFKLRKDGNGLLIEGWDAFLDALRIIIRSSTSLRSLHHSCNQSLLWALEVNKIPNDNFFCKLFLKYLPILLISRETVDKIPSIPISCNSSIEESYDEIRADQFPFLHEILEFLGEGSSFLFLLA